jgi:hypothetical protein
MTVDSGCPSVFDAGLRLVPAGEPSCPDSRGSDVVNVHAPPGRWRRRAVCTCSWEGSPRLIAARATVDALTHAATAAHEPGWPLIVRTPSHGHTMASLPELVDSPPRSARRDATAQR